VRTVSSATREKLRVLVTQIGVMETADEAKRKLERLVNGGGDAVQVAKAEVCIELGLAVQDIDARRAVGFIAGPVLARHLAPGEVLDAKIDVLISLLGTPEDLRLMLPRIPRERRVTIWERELAWAREEGNRDWKRFLVERFARELGDVLTEATAFADAYLAAIPPEEREAAPARRVFAPTKPNALYAFADPWIVNAGDWEHFDAAKRKQLVIAADRMLGKKIRSARGLARAIDDEFDDFELRHWHVYATHATESDAPVFDCWVFRVDNAVFFRHGTLERVPVYVVQDSFMNDDNEAPSRELAEALQASAPSTLWAT